MAWFAVNLVHPVGPPLLLWLPIPVGAVLAALVLRRTASTVALPAPTRRFWGLLGVAAVLVGIAATAQAVDVLLNPDIGGSYNGPVLLVFDSRQRRISSQARSSSVKIRWPPAVRSMSSSSPIRS